MVGRTSQRPVPAGFEAAVIKAMQHAAQHVELFQQNRQRLAGVHRRAATALAGGVFLHRGLELVANADVVHHQPALLVLEHPVDAGDGLHQVMTFHRFIHVHGVDAGGVKAGEPHVAHDHQLQRVGRVLETLFQPFLDLGAVDVGAQQGLVAGAAGHDDLDRPLLRVWTVPLGAQFDDFVVQMHADFAAHGHGHRLAVLRLVARLEMRHQVGGHVLHAGLRADELFQRGPLRLQPGLGAFLFVFGQLVHLVVDLGQFAVLEFELGQAAFVVNGNGGAVFARLLHVVNMDVVAKHRAGVAVGAAHRRAGKGHKRGMGQRIAQMLGVTGLVAGGVFGGHKMHAGRGCRASAVCGQHRARNRRPGLAGLEGGGKAVLGAVGLVGNHHDVVPVRKHREHVLVFTGHELLDRGKHNPARWPVRQQLPQFLPGRGLHRLFAQQVLRQTEDAKELAVQVVAVGNHHHGRVLHGWFLHHPGGETGHGDALAAALRMPHHAALALYLGRAFGLRSRHHMRHGGAHRVVLMVAGNLLNQAAIVLEQHKAAQIIQQHRRRQHALHQRLQLVECAQRVQVHPVDGAPLHETLGVGRQAAQAGLAAV